VWKPRYLVKLFTVTRNQTTLATGMCIEVRRTGASAECPGSVTVATPLDFQLDLCLGCLLGNISNRSRLGYRINSS
jgi:hypothetical protein